MRDVMTEVLQDILFRTDKEIIDKKIIDFKEKMKKVELSEIALPTGVKRLSHFADTRHSNKKIYGEGSILTPMHKGTPVHVKAAWVYNDLLKYHKLSNVEKIKNSEKIKWVYLKQNPLGIAQIAFKGYDDPSEIMDFIKQYVDYDKIFERVLNKKIKTWYEALSWTEPLDKKYTLDRFF